MGLEKAILHGKEKRKPYTGAKRYFRSCRNHGGCPWCTRNRTYKMRDRHPRTKEDEEWEQRSSGLQQESE